MDIKLKQKLIQNNHYDFQHYLSQNEFDYLISNDLYYQDANQLYKTVENPFLKLPEHIIFSVNKGDIKIIRKSFKDRHITFSEGGIFHVVFKKNKHINNILFVHETKQNKIVEITFSNFYLLIDKNPTETHERIILHSGMSIDLFKKQKKVADIQYCKKMEYFINTHFKKSQKEFFNNSDEHEKALFLMNFNIPEKAQIFFFL